MQREDYKVCDIKNLNIHLTTVSGVCNYNITVNGVVVYRGRGYGEDEIIVPLGEIVSDYLGSKHFTIPFSELTLIPEEDGFLNVDVNRIVDDTHILNEWFGVLRSYDYGWEWDGGSATLSEPINGKIDSRMQLLYSVYRETTEEDIEIGIVPVVVVSPMQIFLPAMDITSYFTVQSNVPYTVSSASEWFDVEQDSLDPNKWNISVEENTGDTRTASVVVAYEDEWGQGIQQTVYVTQAEPIFEVEPINLEFTPDAATQYITVNSNIKFNVQAGDNWLTVEPISGASGTTIIEVTAAQYSGLTDRESTVTVGRETVSVTQDALAISVEPSSLSFLPAGGAATVQVTANGAYDVSSNRYWAVPSVSAGTSGTTTITIAVDEYTGSSANRGASITIGNQTLSISQEKVSITVTPSAMTLSDAMATGYTVSVDSNVPWSSYTLSGNWILRSPETGETGVTEVAITVLGNETATAHTGDVSFYNGTYSVYHQIFQPGLSITLSEDSFDISGATSAVTVTITSNGDYNISTEDDWIHLSASSGTSGTTTLTITFDYNMSDETRTGTVTVGTKQISISQESSFDSMYFTVDEYSVDEGYDHIWTSVGNYSLTACDDKSKVYMGSPGSWNGPYTGTTYSPSRKFTTPFNIKGECVECDGYYYPPTVALYANYGTLQVYGNVMSLSLGDAFTSITSVSEWRVPELRDTSKIEDASKLYLPALDGISRYPELFKDITTLKTAPELTHSVLNTNEYRQMFSGCTNLNYIKCLATDISASGCTYEWVAGVAPTGLFIKKKGMMDWTRGVNGVPVGWVLVPDEGVEVVPSSIEFESTGAAITVTASSLDSYAVTTDVEWLTLSAVSGASGETVFTITASENTGTTRNATVTFGDEVLAVSQDTGVYTAKYLTFRVLTGGTLYWTSKGISNSKNISYSKDNGRTWTQITSTTGGTPITVEDGDKVLLKGTETRYGGVANFSGSTAYFDIEGNIMSLLYGDNFTGQTALGDIWSFTELFSFTNAVNAGNLVLPSTALTESCYGQMFDNCHYLTTAPVLPAVTLAPKCYLSMFQSCSSLSTAPELPATALVERCYGGMFFNCGNLNYIKCLATSGTLNTNTVDWTYGVAPTGTFIKAASANWSSGVSGIPTGWTVYDGGVVISPSSGSVAASGGSVTVTAYSTSAYTITTAAEWVTLSASAGTSGTSVITITASENTGNTRTATVYFDETVFTLNQASPSPVSSDKFIYYTTTDGQPLTMNAATWTQNIVSHTYGVIEFDNDVTAIPNDAFSGQTTLATVTLPSSIETIGQHSFRYTSGLTMNFDTRNYPNLTSIGTTAFQGSNLSGCSVYLGSGLTLGTAIFGATKIYSAYTDSTTTGTTSEIGPQLPQIRSVHFGPNVTHIRNICSNNSGNLVEIIFDGTTAPSYSANAFSTSPGPGVMYYPSGSNYNGIISKLSSDWTIIPV